MSWDVVRKKRERRSVSSPVWPSVNTFEIAAEANRFRQIPGLAEVRFPILASGFTGRVGLGGISRLESSNGYVDSAARDGVSLWLFIPSLQPATPRQAPCLSFRTCVAACFVCASAAPNRKRRLADDCSLPLRSSRSSSLATFPPEPRFRRDSIRLRRNPTRRSRSKFEWSRRADRSSWPSLNPNRSAHLPPSILNQAHSASRAHWKNRLWTSAKTGRCRERSVTTLSRWAVRSSFDCRCLHQPFGRTAVRNSAGRSH